jgi:hypothetical protein
LWFDYSYFLYTYFLLRQKKVAKKGRFWPTAPQAKRALYAVILRLYSTAWRWFFARW